MADLTATFTTEGPCACCGGTPPAGCACALLIPPTMFGAVSPYADLATAQAAISNLVADCLLYAASSDGAEAQLDTYTISVATGISIHLASASRNRGHGVICLALLNGETVTVAAAVTANGTNPARPAFVGAALYGCDGTLIDSGTTIGSASAASDTFTFTAPADGIYFLTIEGGGAGDATSFDLTDSISFSAAFAVNPVIALWDDSGTTRQLEACPSLILPYDDQDASPDHWFPSLSDAEFTLLHNISTGCLGYTSSRPNTFTVAFSAGSLAVVGNTPNASPPSASNSYFECLVSVNAEAGKTLSIAYVVSGPLFSTLIFVDATIYDDSRNLVEYLSSASPMVSSALPYTGKYVIRLRCQFDDSPISTAWTITSSGTMTVNPVELWYDTGLDCPARLECDDSHTYMPDYDDGGGGPA